MDPSGKKSRIRILIIFSFKLLLQEQTFSSMLPFGFVSRDLNNCELIFRDKERERGKKKRRRKEWRRTVFLTLNQWVGYNTRLRALIYV